MPASDAPKPTRSRTRRSDAGQSLVNALVGSDALPALIEQMNPATLKRLVADVGIEDAGALVVHASETQLTHLLDETIWTGAKPGDPESLSVENLLRWIAVWTDAGVASEKFFELGDDFCALALSRLVVVVDTDMAPRVGDEFTQVLGEYIVRARQDDEWDVVQAGLNAIWDDYPDFLEAVLGRLAFRHSVLGMYGEDDTARVLNADASHARERKREAGGFVTSVMAGAFLRRVAATDLDELAAENRYDLDTTEYFRRRASEAAERAESAAARDAERDRQRASRAPTDDEEAELDALQAELEAYEAQQAAAPALLTGPADARARQPIRTALNALGESPDALAERADELAYLANLLVTGVMQGGERINEAAAAEIAMATANLGGSYLLWVEFGNEASAEAFGPLLADAPGVVKLFRIGWHLLARVPVQVAARLDRLLADETVRERLASRPMVLEEVNALLSDGELLEQVRAEAFEDARETLRLLTILFEPQAVFSLCALTDAVPALPVRLADAARDEATVWDAAAERTRQVDSMADLMLIDQFLRSLADQLRA